MNERNFYLNLIKENIVKCDHIITKLDEKGRSTHHAKVLLSDLEAELHDLNGKNRMRYKMDVVVDCYELSEFYLESLRKRGRIL